MSFHDFTRFIFWILVETCSYKSFEGFHAIFEIFGFLYEQWSQIGVGIEKIGRIQTCQIFGSADGPRVRGGQSAIHGTCSPEALQRSSQPQKYTADGPPKDRGRSAHVGQILPEAVLFGLQCKNFKGGRSAGISRTVRDWTERWGRPDLTYIGWSNLFGLVWNLVCMPYTYDTSCCTSFMRIWWGVLRFLSGSCQCCAVVFSIHLWVKMWNLVAI